MNKKKWNQIINKLGTVFPQENKHNSKIVTDESGCKKWRCSYESMANAVYCSGKKMSWSCRQFFNFFHLYQQKLSARHFLCPWQCHGECFCHWIANVNISEISIKASIFQAYFYAKICLLLCFFLKLSYLSVHLCV